MIYEPSLLAESVSALSSSLTPLNVATLSAMVAWSAGSRGTAPRNLAPIAGLTSYVRPLRPILYKSVTLPLGDFC